MSEGIFRKFYTSKQWKECRLSYIASVCGLCESCGNVGKILHHKVHLTRNNINDTNIALGWDNLIYLCKPCHEYVHSNSSTGDNIMFDEEGNVINLE